MAERLSDLADALWPHLARRVAQATGSTAALNVASPTDHGALTGLLDDDHPQYLTAGRGDGRYPALADWSSHIGNADAHHARLHVLATNAGLGSDHTISGTAAGHVLRASSATAAAFAQLAHSDLSAIGTNTHTQIDSHIANSDIHVAHSGVSMSAGDGLTGGGTIAATRSFAVALSAVSGLELTGTSPNKTLQIADSVAGAGLASNNKVLSVGVSGLGLSVGADAVALTSSSNPGAAASILASDATGKLTLPLVVATTSLTTPLIVAGAGQSLTLQPPIDLILDPLSNIARMGSGASIQASSYASQTTGWRVTDAGEADFRYLFVDEMHAKSFIADLEQALAGGQIIGKSVAVVHEPFALPAAGATGTLRVRDLPSAPNMAVFQSGDFIGLRQFSRAAGSLTIGWAWGTVTGYVDGTGGNEGTQTWTFSRNPGTPGAATGVIPAEAIVLDFGVSGNGFYEVNAIDGAYGQNSPYAQVVTWATHPATQTVRTRMGNLRGIFSVANEFGLYAGSGTGITDRYIRASSAALELRNVPLALYDGTNNTMLLSAGASNNSPFMALGSALPTGPLTGDGIWLGKNGVAYEFRVGTVSGGALVKGLHWDGANLTWKATNTSLDAAGNLQAINATLSGQITATTGAIGGWTIAASGLIATNIGLYSGAANTARVQVGSGSDVAGINATAAAGDIAFWAGDTHANRASADFRVTAAGAMYATTGTIAGDFTVSGSGKLSAGAGGVLLDVSGQALGLYPNIDGGATPPDTAKALAWYDTPSTRTGLQARQYVGKATDGTPHWNVTVNPGGSYPLTMSLWYGGATLNALWFTNLAQVVGLPGLFLAKGTPDTAQIPNGARLQLNSGSEFSATTHLKTAVSNTYDIGEAGVKWRKLYVGEIIADTVSGGTALGGNTWQRGDAGDMYIYSYSEATNRTLYVANPGAGTMSLNVEGNITVGGNVDGVDLSAFKTAYDSHNHDSRYYTETELQTSGSATVHWGNISSKPSTFAPSAHALVGADHTASGLTIGHVIRASGATTFAWAQLAHSDLSGVGTNSHATIDTHITTVTNHIAATAAHGATGEVVGTTNTQTLTNKTLTTPTISATGFTNAQHAHTGATSGGQIAHGSLTDIGTNSHATIDSHIAATSAHGVSGAIVGTTDTQTLSNKTLTTPTISGTGFTNAQHAHTGASSGGQIAHGSLTGVGANDHHAQSHVLATNAGLGADHTINGAAAGQVLRASSATAAAFAAIQDGDLPSTIVRTSRQVIAGNGMTGGGDLSADRTFTLGTPSSLTATSTNAVTATSHTHSITTGAATGLSISSANTEGSGTAIARADHTHAIATSSNPGAAAAILSSTAAGALTLTGLTLTGLAANRLVSSDGSDVLTSVSDLSAWIGGTANRVTVSSDGDGTVTLSAPQDIHTAATPTFGGLIAPWLRPASDSTTALQLRNAAGTAVLTVDTTNSKIGIGNTPSYKFDVSGDVRLTGTLYADGGIVDFGTDYFQEGATYLELKGAKPLYLNQTIQASGWSMSAGGALVSSSSLSAASMALTGAATITGDLTVGGTVLQVSAAGTRVGINRAADQQFDLDVAGAIRGQYLVGPHALQLSDAKAIVHFDGPAPYNLDFSGTSNTHMGENATETGGVIYRPGKFGKAVQLAEATTNLVKDSSFELHAIGTTTFTQWSAWGSPPTRVIYAGGEYGSQCLRLVTDSNNQGVYQVFNVTNALSYTLSFYVKVLSGRPVVYINGTGASGSWEASPSWTGDNQWHRMTYTFTATATGTANIYIGKSAGGVVGEYLIDAVQLEKKAYATPYVDGSLGQGHSWSGTAHASTSSRTTANVVYNNIGIANGSPWTIAGWFNLSQRSGVSNNYALGATSTDGKVSWMYLALNKISMYDSESDSRYRVLLSSSGSSVFDTWVFIALVSDGTNVTAYCNDEVGSPFPLGLGISSVRLRPSNVDEYDATLMADDLFILGYAADAKLIRSIYESNAPVFAESSVVSFRAPTKSQIWVDEFGFWAKGQAGGEAFGIFGGDPRRLTTTKSWGGVTMEENDIVIGRTSAPSYTALHWDDSAGELILGRQAAEHLSLVSGSVRIKNATTVYADLTGSTFILGNAAEENLRLTTGGIEFRNATEVQGSLSGTSWTLGKTGASENNIVITPTTLSLRSGTNKHAELTTAGVLTLGLVSSGDYITVDATNGLRMYGAATLLGQWTATGVVVIGAAANSTSRIEISSGNVNIINRNGSGVDSTAISLTSAGNASFAGAITATSGSIAGAVSVGAALTIGTGGSLGSGATSYAAGTGVWLEHNAGTPRLRIGTTAGNRLVWDGADLEWYGVNTSLTKAGAFTATNATITGVITANTGFIGGASGWTIATGAITSNNIGLYSGAANTVARIEVGTGTTLAGINSASASGHVAFWAGSSYANRATANFNVTAGGTLTAKDGTVGGWTLGASSLTGGNAVLSNTGVLTLGTSNNVAVMSAADANYRLWIGHASAASAPFAVSKGGALVSTSGLIGGWAITSTSIQGGADAKLYATGKMELGTILGMVVLDPNHADWRIWVGSAADIATNPLAGQFRVSDDGYLTASGATIYGHLVANSGDFAGAVTIGTSGGIYQGTGTFASPMTGLKIWNDSGVGRIGGYNTGTLQWYAGTDGKLYAGGGNALMDSSGMRVVAPTSSWDITRSFGFLRSNTTVGGLSALAESSTTTVALMANATDAGAGTPSAAETNRHAQISLVARGAGGGSYHAGVSIRALRGDGVNSAQITMGTDPSTWMEISASTITMEGNAIFNYGLSADEPIVANEGIRIKGDPAPGDAGEVSLSNQVSGVSTGVGTVKMGGSSNANSTGWLKIYVDGSPRYIPYWSVIAG